MKRTLAALALLAATSSFASAQDWAKAKLSASPRHGEFVTITEPGGRKLQAWVVYPEIKEKAPVVVMIHEIFGLSDWAREMADEVAGAGYIVVEPDLLSGYGPTTGAAPAAAPMPEDHAHMHTATPGSAMVPATPGGTAAFPDVDSARRAVAALPQDGVTADLNAAADYGKALTAANGKLYVAGFCWGGQQTFDFATHRKDVSSYFVFYGPPPTAAAMKNITAPVYGFYAGNDARVTSTIAQATLDMKAAGKTYEPVTYDGAGHGFMRAGEAPDANAANTAARQQGFRRLIQLLGGMH
ncbi:dienelactone hydrolase family protein [Granulicella cerasi]|uniref:Dienelactone hydrolase family protein n=1 Tax=Granulicella cerasi TaxID=741063 RepID=A0ABW1Z8B0_9BACT|nr:dienelactone hydrolase family protein [Granulicella cerasi]